MSKEFTQPAFPVPGLQHDEDFNGMSLRDYFAAKAMQAVLGSGDFLDSIGSLCGSQAELQLMLADAAYSQADAMLAARSA